MPDDIFGSYALNSRPSSDFNYVAAKNKLVNLELSANGTPSIIFTSPGEELTGGRACDHAHPGSIGRQGRLMRLAGWIDLDSKLTARFDAHFRFQANH
jgi:DNA mismatch repair protein MSH5